VKTFVCLAYVTTLYNVITKFDNRAKKFVFLGYRQGTKGYLICDTTSQNFLVSRNVIFYFYENVFPFSVLSSNKLQVPILIFLAIMLIKIVSVLCAHLCKTLMMPKNNLFLRNIVQNSNPKDYHASLSPSQIYLTISQIPFPLSSSISHDKREP